MYEKKKEPRQEKRIPRRDVASVRCFRNRLHRGERFLAAILLCTALFFTGGCSQDEPLYMAGEQQTGEAFQETVSLQSADAVSEESFLKPRSAVSTEAEEAVSEMQEETEGFLFVCGAVEHPGVYPVHPGMRVYEAVSLAGGFSQEADEEWLNQAAPVADGQRLYVYTREETAAMKESGLSRAEAGSTAQEGSPYAGITETETVPGFAESKVNLNTASREELMTLPGIGEAKADAILQYREQNGGFGAIEEIQNISGIKSGVFEKLRDRITI